MLIYDDYREHFYKVVQAAKNVIIVTHNDVDALCSTIILTDLFERDEVIYSMVVVREWSELADTFRLFKQSSNVFVLLNCGAFRSLLDFDVEGMDIFVIDSQRPVDLSNVYASQVVKVLCRQSEVEGWQLPSLESVVELGSDDSDSDQDNEDEENRDIASRIQRRLLRQKNRELWKQTRDKLVWDYQIKTYVEFPSAVLLLQLAHSMGKSSAELSWCACVALSSLVVDQVISLQSYTSICVESMRTFTRLYAPRTHVKNDSTLRISFNKELCLPLYSHWTLHDSVTHDVNFLSSCRLWTQNGLHKLRNTYARLGVPLAECASQFSTIPTERRTQLFDILDEELTKMNATFATFFSHFAFSRQFNSADFARVLSLKLEYSDKPAHPVDLFLDGMDFMKRVIWRNGGSCPDTDRAIDTYKYALKAIVGLAYDCMRQSIFMNTNTFYALYVPESPTVKLLEESSHCLNLFMYVALRIFASVRRGYRVKKPLIISLCPKLTSSGESFCLISGIMPLQSLLVDPERRSLIPRLFATIHDDPKVDTRYDRINPNVIHVRDSNRVQFFEQIEHRLS